MSTGGRISREISSFSISPGPNWNFLSSNPILLPLQRMYWVREWFREWNMIKNYTDLNDWLALNPDPDAIELLKNKQPDKINWAF